MVERRDSAGLAVTAMVVAVADTDRLGRAELVGQVGDHADAVRAGLAGGVHFDRVERIAVAIQIDAAEIGRAADIAGQVLRGGAAAERVRAFIGLDRAGAAVRLHILVAGSTVRTRPSASVKRELTRMLPVFDGLKL